MERVDEYLWMLREEGDDEENGEPDPPPEPPPDGSG